MSEVERVAGVLFGMYVSAVRKAGLRGSDDDWRSDAEYLLEQIEALISERVRAAQAEALREAADEWVDGEGWHIPFSGQFTPASVDGWLRARADHIAQDAPESAPTAPLTADEAQDVPVGQCDVGGAQIEAACEIMHDAYEAAAIGAGWETQQSSRKPWANVPDANKATMRAAVKVLLEHIAAKDRT